MSIPHNSKNVILIALQFGIGFAEEKVRCYIFALFRDGHGGPTFWVLEKNYGKIVLRGFEPKIGFSFVSDELSDYT